MTARSLPDAGEVSGASFRDPSGFVFRRHGAVLRQVNRSYATHFATLMDSGLYDELVGAGYLVAHETIDEDAPAPERALCVIRPEPIPFISYPYEWCFGQLRSAALLTLEVQRLALRHGMVLKDASAFNIQFLRGRPVLIDTLSFEAYEEGRPWMAYRQFCEHFLAPLLLMRDVDPRLGRLSTLTVDGVPLDLASRLLPRRSYLSPSIQLHIHQHARLSRRYGGRKVPEKVSTRGLSRSALVNLIEGLEHLVGGLAWEPKGTEWADYDTDHGYSREDHERKGQLVAEMLERLEPARSWDLGANTGDFSRIARATGSWVLAADVDPAAVERNYQRSVGDGEQDIHPLLLDLRNPTPALGWGLRERESIVQRANADVVLALALIHHLAIGGNVPLARIAAWFAELAPHLIIEFVPKNDPQVRRLLVSRPDIFADYSLAGFVAAFERHFKIRHQLSVGDSGRIIFHLERRAD